MPGFGRSLTQSGYTMVLASTLRKWFSDTNYTRDSMLPINLTQIVHESLVPDRPSSGNLNCSSDIIGPLRHTMLRRVNAPKVARPLVEEMAPATGTFWHGKITEL